MLDSRAHRFRPDVETLNNFKLVWKTLLGRPIYYFRGGILCNHAVGHAPKLGPNRRKCFFDAEFRSACLTAPLYFGRLETPKVRALLTELEAYLRTTIRSEEPVLPDLSQLDVDHILPRSWFAFWALARMIETTFKSQRGFTTSLGQHQPLQHGVFHVMVLRELLVNRIDRAIRDIDVFGPRVDTLRDRRRFLVNRGGVLTDMLTFPFGRPVGYEAQGGSGAY